jgi:subtilisin family serine protease
MGDFEAIFRGKRELVVITRAGLELRASPPSAAGPQLLEAPGSSVAAMKSALESFGGALRPLFGVSEQRMSLRQDEVGRLRATAPSASARSHSRKPADLTRFYGVVARDQDLEDIQQKLLDVDAVETAYIKPPADVPTLNAMQPSGTLPPLVTPDFSDRQKYLGPAPVGVDARFAWTRPGGTGKGVHIIDLEWGWRFTHECLQQSCGLVAGALAPDDNHGTAVLGELTATANGFGVTGICPGARSSTVSFPDSYSQASYSEAIRIAADRAKRGDILLLEVHRPGPNANGVDQHGFIPIEWWPDEFAIIGYAVDKGLIVVEAGGNGAQDLDDPVYNRRMQYFPDEWLNPFNVANPSSGAVIVGAGAPPVDTHGRDHGPDRSRLDFSNYGARVDAQGWGREVTTTGYGDLQGGWDRNQWYTDQFSGTSSAAPIVAGALACIQGMLQAQGRSPLNSYDAIELLRATGSPQDDAQGRPRTQRIGNRPDIRAMASHLRL